MGSGCSRDSNNTGLEPSTLERVPSSKKNHNSVTTSNQSGETKYDTSIQPYVSTLETFELPPPPTTRQVG
eukprot:gene8231-10157_t